MAGAPNAGLVGLCRDEVAAARERRKSQAAARAEAKKSASSAAGAGSSRDAPAEVAQLRLDLEWARKELADETFVSDEREGVLREIAYIARRGKDWDNVLDLTDTYWDEDLADTYWDEDLAGAQDRERSRSPRRDCAGLLRRLEEGCDRASVEAAVVDMGPGHWQEAFRVLHPEWQPPMTMAQLFLSLPHTYAWASTQ